MPETLRKIIHNLAGICILAGLASIYYFYQDALKSEKILSEVTASNITEASATGPVIIGQSMRAQYDFKKWTP